MWQLRAETPADRAAIRAVNAEAFGRDDEAQLVDALRASPAFVPELSLVAVDEGEIVGHILFSRVHIGEAARRVDAIALAPMAVRPARQRRGIGAALLRHGLSECARLGHSIVVVVGHPAYYPRFGFKRARGYGLEAPFPVPDGAFLVRELIAGGLRGVRGVIEYPPPFALV